MKSTIKKTRTNSKKKYSKTRRKSTRRKRIRRSKSQWCSKISNTFKTELKTRLHYYERDTNMFQYCLNIFLVFAGVRDGTLIEYNNIMNHEERNRASSQVNNFINFLNAHATSINKLIQQATWLDYRIMIMRESFVKSSLNLQMNTHESIGKILNFICVDHDFANNTVDRLLIDIKEIATGSNIYSEACEMSKINIEHTTKLLTSRIKKWDNATRKYNLSYKFKFRLDIDISVTTRIHNIDNKKYVMEHEYDYANDLYNYFHLYFDEDQFYKYIDKYLLFKIIYLIGVKDQIFMVLTKTKDLNDIEKLQLKLYEFDKELIKLYRVNSDNFKLIIRLVSKYFSDNSEFISKFRTHLSIYRNIYGKI